MSHSSGQLDLELSELEEKFYRKVLRLLTDKEITFLVGGSYAASYYTGRDPHTKDLDLFLPSSQVERALEVLDCAGIDSEYVYRFWLAKAFEGDQFVDLIFRAASGLWEIEEDWRRNASATEMWGVPVLVCGVEELVWTKAALMDRERYDGNDVLHLLQAKAHELDWDRLRNLAGDDWRLLLSHLTLFGYVYPDLIPLVPKHLLAEMSLRLLSDQPLPEDDEQPLCRGTLISNSQYQEDVEELGYRDARLVPWGKLTPQELKPWIEAVKRGDT